MAKDPGRPKAKKLNLQTHEYGYPSSAIGGVSAPRFEDGSLVPKGYVKPKRGSGLPVRGRKRRGYDI